MVQQLPPINACTGLAPRALYTSTAYIGDPLSANQKWSGSANQNGSRSARGSVVGC